jgi:hypothetical protein
MQSKQNALKFQKAFAAIEKAFLANYKSFYSEVGIANSD